MGFNTNNDVEIINRTVQSEIKERDYLDQRTKAIASFAAQQTLLTAMANFICLNGFQNFPLMVDGMNNDVLIGGAS